VKLAKAKLEPHRADLAAEVGDQPIPRSEVDALLKLKFAKYTERKRQPPTSAAVRYQRSITGRLVAHSILAQETKALGLKDDEAAVERRAIVSKRGVSDWARHLELRSETEESLRAMWLDEERESAIIEATTKLELTPSEIDQHFCREHADLLQPKERRLVSSIPVPDAAMGETIAAEVAKNGFEATVDRHPELKGFPDQLVEQAADDWAKLVFEVEPGTPKAVASAKGYHYVVHVTAVFEPGSLPAELLLEQTTDSLRGVELTAERARFRARMVDKYPVTVYGLPPEPDASE
jgi:hypothetical protein